MYGIISQREEEYACLKDLQTNEKIEYQSELDQLKKVNETMMNCQDICPYATQHKDINMYQKI